MRRAEWAALAVLAFVSLAVSGCGASGQRTSNLRPPTLINISVEIGESRISASPTKFGAGPIAIVASNQSRVSRTLTIDGPRVRQSVGPINPEDTATLKVNVNPGEYTLSADGSATLGPARLTVGPKRPSAQNKVLQP